MPLVTIPRLGYEGPGHRHEATLSGRRLTISEAGFSATYDLNDQGGLSATYMRGQIVSHAAMTRADLASLTVPGAVVAWTCGKSELLQTALVEDGKPVDLEVVIFRPAGVGPFPLAIFNHGSTGRGITPLLFTETWFDVGLADFLNDRGWIVAFPQRRGRGKSDGLYDEGFSADRREGYTCDFDTSLSGAERALNDIAAAMAALRQRPDVAPSRVLIGGVLSWWYPVRCLCRNAPGPNIRRYQFCGRSAGNRLRHREPHKRHFVRAGRAF